MPTIFEGAKHRPKCRTCQKSLTDRIKRSKMVKTFFFWLPLKRYFCNNCGKKIYVLN